MIFRGSGEMHVAYRSISHGCVCLFLWRESLRVLIRSHIERFAPVLALTEPAHLPLRLTLGLVQR